jgi:1,2-phenylacetyl-CoA epoxidase catalytic subunit|tara:strand:- start:262 stop:486 length:225 start_codon:yes stop_codon:yes gene_type:complete
MEEKKVKQKQINLTLPTTLLDAAKDYMAAYSYKNIQELATEALREKIFHIKETKEVPEQSTEPTAEKSKKHYIL